MLFIRPALGLLQGTIIYWLLKYTPFSSEGMACALIVLTFPLFALQVKLPRPNAWGLALRILIPMALVYGYVAYYLFMTLLDYQDHITSWLAIQMLVSAFLFFIFYCAVIEENAFVLPYGTLFHEAWQVIIKILLGQILVTLTLGLCWLAGMLFNLLNITLVQEIVTSEAFFYVMPSFFFGMAMALLFEYEDIITKFRNIVLAFCQFLYPLFVVISLSFLLLIPFSNKPFVSFWEIIISLCCINIFLFNGIYQDGKTTPPYLAWFRGLIYALMILLLGYSVYILHYPLNTMQRYGFKAEVFLEFIFLSLLALYHFAYTAAIFFSKRAWLGGIMFNNTAIALLMATLYLILALPWFDLSHFTAQHQKARLLSNLPIFDIANPLDNPGYLVGVDLHGANLQGHDLRYINFSNSNLQGANLRQANLSFSNLSNANLSQANLSQVNMQSASLIKTNLSQANLTGAKVNLSSFNQNDFSQANISDIDFTHVYGLQESSLQQACGENVIVPKSYSIKPCK